MTLISEQECTDSSPRERKKAAQAQVLQLLPTIFEYSRWNRAERTEEIGREIAQLLQDSHPALAKKITKQLASMQSPVRIVHKPERLVDFCAARHGLEGVILPESVETECRSIVAEHQRAHELASFKLNPRHKVLLYGPPGNGKTLLAEAMAKELDCPFLPIKYAGLIDSHLGGTGKNLQDIFDYAATSSCVLFMDEFDGIAIDRADAKDVGEIRRVTNQMLILLDRLPAHCVFIAATNANELLDRAIQRRFDYVIELPAPTPELLLRVALQELATNLTPGHDVTALAQVLGSLALPNMSSLVKLCQRIRRDLVLNQGAGIEAIIAGEQRS